MSKKEQLCKGWDTSGVKKECKKQMRRLKRRLERKLLEDAPVKHLYRGYTV